MAERTLVRVELEYSDGEVWRLTGDQAQKWLDAANGQAVHCSLHGMDFPDLDWSRDKSPEEKV